MVHSLSEFDLSNDWVAPPTCLSTPEPMSRHAVRRTYSCNPDRRSRVFGDGASPGSAENAEGSGSPYDGILEGSFGRSSDEVSQRSRSCGRRTYAHAPSPQSAVDQLIFGRDVDNSGETQFDEEFFRDNFEGACGLQTRDSSKSKQLPGRIKFHDPFAPRNCIGRVVFNQENAPLDVSLARTTVNLQDRFAGAAGVHTLAEDTSRVRMDTRTGTIPVRARIEDHPCHRSQVTEEVFHSGAHCPTNGSPEAKHHQWQRGMAGAAGSRPGEAWECRNYENPRALRKPRGGAGHAESTWSRVLGGNPVE